MYKIPLFIFFMIVTFEPSVSRETQKNKPILKKEQLELIYQYCVQPDIIHIEMLSKNFLEAAYLCEGDRYEIGIKDNEFLYLEKLLTKEDVPYSSIMQKLSKKYPDWEIDAIAGITTQDTSFLKVEIVKDEVEQNCYFTHDGKWLKIMPIDITSTFDYSVLEENKTYRAMGYNFLQPTENYELPDILREISGITLSPDYSRVYCVQDELGAVFKYDFAEQKVINVYRFADIGDFEDLTLAGDSLYILRSDGNLFIYDIKREKKTAELMLPVKSLNIEGISFHKGEVYVACKDAAISQSEDKRTVYRAPVNRLQALEEYLEISRNQLLEYLKNTYPDFAVSGFLFNPSAVAVHPVTEDIYVLSATERFLAVYRAKELHHLIPLPADVYYKPEGLSFNSEGDLFISSEGDKRGFVKALIYKIKWEANGLSD